MIQYPFLTVKNCTGFCFCSLVAWAWGKAVCPVFTKTHKLVSVPHQCASRLKTRQGARRWSLILSNEPALFVQIQKNIHFWLLMYTSLNMSRSFGWSTREVFQSSHNQRRVSINWSTWMRPVYFVQRHRGSCHLYPSQFCRMQSVAISSITWVSGFEKYETKYLQWCDINRILPIRWTNMWPPASGRPIRKVSEFSS